MCYERVFKDVLVCKRCLHTLNKKSFNFWAQSPQDSLRGLVLDPTSFLDPSVVDLVIIIIIIIIIIINRHFKMPN